MAVEKILDLITKKGFITADATVKKIRSARFEKKFGQDQVIESEKVRSFGRIFNSEGLPGVFSLSGTGSSPFDAELSIVNLTRFNPVSRGPGSIEDYMPGKVKNIPVKIYDPDFENINFGNFSDVLSSLEENCLDFAGLKIKNASLGKRLVKHYFANSAGMNAKFRKTTFSFEAVFSLAGNEIRVARDSTHFFKLDHSKLAQRAYNLLGALKNPGRKKGHVNEILFSPEASSSILRLFSKYFLAGTQTKMNFQFPRVLNIIDSKFLDYESGSAPFDDEGIQGGLALLVEKGMPTDLVTDIQEAARSGLKPTGNGFRKPGNQRVGTGFSNIFIKPTPVAVSKLISGQGEQLFVSLVKLKNRRNDNFLFSVYGYIFRDGERGESVHFHLETSFRSFFSNIVKISREIRFYNSDFNTGSPYLLIEGRKKKNSEIIEI